MKKVALMMKRLTPDELCCLIQYQQFPMHGKKNADYPETHRNQGLVR